MNCRRFLTEKCVFNQFPGIEKKNLNAYFFKWIVNLWLIVFESQKNN